MGELLRLWIVPGSSVLAALTGLRLGIYAYRESRSARSLAIENLRKVQRYDSIEIRMVTTTVTHQPDARPFDRGDLDELDVFKVNLLGLAMMCEYSAPIGEEYSLLAPGTTFDPDDPRERAFSLGLELQPGRLFFDVRAKRIRPC